MNILGMGPMEILLIVVLALIVFGPAKLPEIMSQVGKAIADFRRATSELSDEFNRTIQAELKETRALVDDTKSTVTGVHASINSAITGTPAPVLTAVPGENAANGTAPQATPNGTNGTAPAPVTPPLADTSQWSWETAAPAPAKPVGELGSSDPVVGLSEPAPPVVDTSAAPSTPPVRVRKSVRDELLPPY